MANNVYLIRSDVWPHSDLNPIPETEWEAVADRTPELEKGRDYYARSDEGPYFTWEQGRVVIARADWPDVPLLSELATALQARLVDEDDEPVERDE